MKHARARPAKTAARRRGGEAQVALVTGFAPFDDDTVNPSQEIARALDGATVAGHRVVGAVLPTEFGTALPALRALLRAHAPSVVIAVGLAGGRAEISLERVAINLIDARIADNAGVQPVDVRVLKNGPSAYFSTLPVKAMLARLHAAGIPATLSQSAGTFVCNQVFYGLAHALTRRLGVRGGFVHVPYLPVQAARFAGAPSLPLQTMIEALRICIGTALTVRRDVRFAAGATH
ncbi:MAG: pyroglutamyl-peptidase I [Rudaea sp.]